MKWAALLALAAGASATALWQLRPTAPSTPVAVAHVEEPLVAAPVVATALRAPEAVRPRIEAAVAEALPRIHDPRDLDRYLGDLEHSARAQRHVTALEVEPGMQAIFAMQGELGAEETLVRSREFAQRMMRLSVELGGRAD
jgi:hypothetical protein